MADGRLILIGGALVAAALAASLLAGRLRVPGLLLFLAVGIAVGSDGTGWIHFEDYGLAQDVGVVALALILFEGGLASGWDEIRPVLRPAVQLATLGTLATAAVTGLVAALVLDLTATQALLLGAILSSTDGAAIFALLRGSTLRRRLARTLEGEAGMNDPVAVLLVVTCIELLQEPDFGALDVALLLLEELGIGLAAGLGVGLLAARALRSVRLASAGLYPVASLATAALAFGAASVLHGSGFLAVYLAGLVLGSSASPARRTIATFHDGLAWVAQLALFLTLGLLVFPSRLGDVWWQGLVIAGALGLVARPLGTLAGTAFAGFTSRERVALSWAGLRGGVPVVLATFPVVEGIEGSSRFFDVVFFAVIASTLLQGATFEPVARRLGVTTDEAALPTPLIEPVTLRRLGAEVVQFVVRPEHQVVGRRVRQLELPREALLNVIIRGDQAIPPRGSTRIHAGDQLNVLVRQEVAVEFAELTRRWRHGPMGEATGARPIPRQTLFTSRPHDPERDGDPGRPAQVNQVPVLEKLRTRRDVPGALVVLADGRAAVTGPIYFVGPPWAVQRAANQRLGVARSDPEGAWWREVIGALATASTQV